MVKQLVNSVKVEQFMIDLVKVRWGDNMSYEQYAAVINNIFNTKFTALDVVLYFEPTIQEELLDRKLTYKNATGECCL